MCESKVCVLSTMETDGDSDFDNLSCATIYNHDMSWCCQMSNNAISSEFNVCICEGFGCYAKATTKVAARVGSKGTMFLCLCDRSADSFWVYNEYHNR